MRLLRVSRSRDMGRRRRVRLMNRLLLDVGFLHGMMLRLRVLYLGFLRMLSFRLLCGGRYASCSPSAFR